MGPEVHLCDIPRFGMERSPIRKNRTAHLAALLMATTALQAQIPGKCFEIESILVDACNPALLCPGSSEGQNEMVRFRTGPAPIALNDIIVNWPNNLWRGFEQSATTANLTTQLNATIEDCGWLIEPPNGIIPPGKPVILITSTNMCLAANSFTALVDTVYLTFQAPGNTAGHFANHNNGTTVSPDPVGAPDFRTLIMTHVPTACADTVTYDRSLLVNIYGTYGGFAPENDGATVEFSWPGPPVATYINLGCQAPFVPLTAEATAEGSICQGGTVQLTGTVSGPFNSVQWTGGTGTFGDPNAAVTTYTTGAGDVDVITLQFCAFGTCGSVCAEVTIQLGLLPQVSISADGPTALCPGDQVTLTASGADTYVWSPGGPGASITVNSPGVYVVTGTNACGSSQASISITAAQGPQVTITAEGPTAICPGEMVTLVASGADVYVWTPAGFGPSIVVDTPGIYTVTGTNSCGQGTASIEITEAPGPTVTITSSGTTLCPGGTITLTAGGADSYQWEPGGAGAQIVVDIPGTYTVTGSNACGESTASITITAGETPDITISGDLTPCQGTTTTLTASGADSYQWSTGAGTPSITVQSAGTYTVTGTTACGSAQSSVSVTFIAPPDVSITGGTYLCPSTVLTAVSNGPVLWSTGATTASITVTQPGTYSVTATNACGSAQASIDVVDDPITAAFEALPEEGVAPLLVQFTNFSLPPNAGFTWDFGDGNGSNAYSPSHLYGSPGEYLVTLTATLGTCTASASVVITVLEDEESDISVPNVFTPNGDGVNDQLMVQAKGIERLELNVYNRWGQLVARLERVMQAWDGRTFAGEPVSPGTYFYTLMAKGKDGRDFDLSGTITVLR